MALRTSTLRSFGYAAVAAVAAACSAANAIDAVNPDAAPAPSDPDGTAPPVTPSPDATTTVDGASDATVDATSDATGDGSTLSVTFRYLPGWSGVTEVAVLGQFGQANDWKQPFATLTNDGTGVFTATVPAPASGAHPYLFRVKGDAAAVNPTMYIRYAVDPMNSAFVACPADSPTFTHLAANPCSQLMVPVPATAPSWHVRGAVHSSGHPAHGYLVVLERMEPGSHHFFVDRTTTNAAGAFDLTAAPGSYRVQVLHPTFLSLTDAQRTNPESYAAVRRLLSSGFRLDADVTIDGADVSYDGYAAMQPRDAGTLPTTFDYTVQPGATALAAVYGTGNTIGDPLWVSKASTATSATFDGGFDTSAAGDAGLEPDARYFWGTEQIHPHDGGVTWTGQSMVYPIRWP